RGQWGGTFDPLHIDLSALSGNVFLAYGNAAAPLADIRAGDGDHVGTPEQAYDRFLVFFRWLSKRWDPIAPAVKVSGVGTTQSLHYFSQSLGAEVDFAVSLPPGYDSSQKRYPVLFLLHGYGQTAQDFSGTSLIIN